MVAQFMAQGYSFVAIASDLAMMMRQADTLIRAIRPPGA
jgi:2-dehydro-3-deoxyglucarate aldolase/4-hydroxy-2-oxoheptanedioate aldolase